VVAAIYRPFSIFPQVQNLSPKHSRGALCLIRPTRSDTWSAAGRSIGARSHCRITEFSRPYCLATLGLVTKGNSEHRVERSSLSYQAAKGLAIAPRWKTRRIQSTVSFSISPTFALVPLAGKIRYLEAASGFFASGIIVRPIIPDTWKGRAVHYGSGFGSHSRTR